MASDKELSDFLRHVEKKAFKQAVYAVSREEAALDIVQDAMLKLSEKYADRPASELPMLFQVILKNTVTDYFRREKVRNTHISLFSSMKKTPEADGDGETGELLDVYDPADSALSPDAGPLEAASRRETLEFIDLCVSELPERQREAFLMRYVYDMDVSETAEAMGCSEGSVKTHCSRAVRALSQALKEKGITL